MDSTLMLITLVCVAVLVVAAFWRLLIGEELFELRKRPEITAWQNRPNGRVPAIVEGYGSKFVCLEIEKDMDSWKFVEDVLAAADNIRRARLADRVRDLPGA